MPTDAELKGKINAIAASLSVLEHLVLSMFNDMPKRESVLRNFLDTTERSNVEGLYSNQPESFLTEFEHTRNVLAEAMRDSIASLR